VVPKAAGGNEGLVHMIELTSGLEALKRVPASRLIQAEGINLLDLIGLLLVEAAEDVVRQGLLRDYVERDDLLSVARGRLLLDRQVLERFGQVDRLYCRFDEHEQDITENRLLALALTRAGIAVRDPEVKRRARRLSSLFREICDPDVLDLDAARNLAYDRMNAYYRGAHELAWLLLGGLGVEDVLATGTTDSFAFLLNMNLLFERFVWTLFSRVFHGTEVHVAYQKRNPLTIWDPDANQSYQTIIPDLLLYRRHVGNRLRLPVDAKYKLYDERSISPEDVYQAFMYSYGFSEEGTPARAAIAYPASAGSRFRRLVIRRTEGVQAAEITLLGIPIVDALAELRSGAGPIAESIRRLSLATWSRYSDAEPEGITTLAH
jgi:5-methylcytosine-specific restriction enzyme subunit McrC